MTTFFEKELACHVCGGVGTYTVLGSTNQFGAPDLDTRPPEMMRSTMAYWVQRCASCGYCAPDVSEGSDLAGPTVLGESYIAQLEADGPELATRFLCCALLALAEGERVAAGWCALRAAWACDDAGDGPRADDCRRRAIAHFTIARQSGEAIADPDGSEEAILADLYRRSGDFERAQAVCEEGLARGPEALLASILRLQASLASRGDRDAYTMDALESEPG